MPLSSVSSSSSITMSGFNSDASLTVSIPLRASPQTVHPEGDVRSERKPLRRTSWQSATRILNLAIMAHVCAYVQPTTEPYFEIHNSPDFLQLRFGAALAVGRDDYINRTRVLLADDHVMLMDGLIPLVRQ